MESRTGNATAAAIGAASEPPQYSPLPGVEGAFAPAELDGAVEGAAGGSGCGDGEGGGGPRRALRAVYVRSESSQGGAAGCPEAGAWQCLLRACEAEGAHLTSVYFGELDFGETAVLDAFYDAGESGFVPTSVPLYVPSQEPGYPPCPLVPLSSSPSPCPPPSRLPPLSLRPLPPSPSLP
ncbi:hypothetical protein P7K49_038295 [Saguinus oedipus]|uniref:MAP3K deoxyribohydrolase domain-containing protein n=1 Tax=Saguinus oedipus TaxID=9490 RepID=A0ABQ9TEB0_SAGOE|nr:hypothetical protein P7K49_038295 [Saguinus oedipus]